MGAGKREHQILLTPNPVHMPPPANLFGLQLGSQAAALDPGAVHVRDADGALRPASGNVARQRDLRAVVQVPKDLQKKENKRHQLGCERSGRRMTQDRMREGGGH